MSESHRARVFITNNTDGHASIQITHKHHDSKLITLDQGVFDSSPGQTVGPFEVKFDSGIGTGLDYWWIGMTVRDGTTPGIYSSSGSSHEPGKECLLRSSDANKDMTFTVDSKKFDLNIPSGSCSTNMHFDAPYSVTSIKHVFVLMLENRSFDHLLGFSGITGKDAATGAATAINGLSSNNSNTYKNIEYKVKSPAIDPMPLGPDHEFAGTLEQLCGEGTSNPYKDSSDDDVAYPEVDNSGFVANYHDEIHEKGKSGVSIDNVMACCDSAKQVPALYALAREYAVCDNWFSSMPGPTWPNRLFAMGASSNGLDDSPSAHDVKKWETHSGFEFPNGSIFDLLKKQRFKYGLYNDSDDQFSIDKSGKTQVGGFPIVAGLDGIQYWNVKSFSDFSKDLVDSYPNQFTFIEPNYGDVRDDTFKNGSSQHPTDTLGPGDRLIAATYNAIRNSPLWESSVLIITYDEHGGFYDHVDPPAARVPDDGSEESDLNTNGFTFNKLGVRVPAVVISPLIPKNTIDHKVYDHTTILKTVEKIFRMPNLTKRDKHAHSLNHLFSLQEPRTDCLGTIVWSRQAAINATTDGVAETPDVVEESLITSNGDDEPLPEKGNLIGFLQIALKTHLEMSATTDAEKQAIIEKVQKIKTQGEAREYMISVAENAKTYKPPKTRG